MKHDVYLEGGAVSLSPLTINDIGERYLSWLADPEVTIGTEISSGARLIDDARVYIENSLLSPCDAMWRINYGAAGHVGNIRLSGINRRHRRSRIALLVGEKAVWGQGVGSAAIDLLSQHAFQGLGLHKLTAGIYQNNIGSRRAFEKAHYMHEATLQDEALFDDEFIDVWLMSRFSNGINDNA